MNFGFWAQLEKPILALAPMADVTDAAFRRVIAKYGKPHIVWTEFVSADGLCSVGRDKLLPDLWFTEGERPIVAQLFGGKPENFYEAAKLIRELGFDGIDINMGCPSKDIEKNTAGAALIKDPALAVKIIEATKAGAGDLPVSVKTRIGYKTNEIETWLPALLAAKPAAITIHARTRNEMSKVPARWEVVARAVEIAQEMYPDPAERPLILGNGDVETIEQARNLTAQTGADGVMIGRGIFGNPWLFSEQIPSSLHARLQVMLEHTQLFDELLTGIKPLDFMKKHYKAYVSGFAGAAELRAELMLAEGYEQIAQIVENYMATHPDIQIS